MAKNVASENPEGKGTTAGHNVANIHETIKSAAGRILKLEETKNGILADIREVKAEVKGVGIKLADFNAALRLYKLEGEERAESITNFQLCFEALSIGDQSELFPKAGKANGSDAAK